VSPANLAGGGIAFALPGNLAGLDYRPSREMMFRALESSALGRVHTDRRSAKSVLFPNTKPAEDFSQDIIVVDLTDD
jgi:hypothetical protein